MIGSPAPATAASTATTGAPGARPRLLARVLARVSDGANPMLVRMVRQELRNRAFVGVFSLLLIGACIAAVFAAAISDGDLDGRVSQGFFTVIAWLWGFSLIVVQPSTVFRAVSTERNDDTWDLVELTGMRPLRILRGLMMASLVQAMLYTSALAPFMVMAYLLRGLDISYIAFVLVAVPLCSIAASSLAAFCACLGRNRAWRGLLGGLLGMGLLGAWAGMGSLLSPYELRSFISELVAWETEAWIGLLVMLNLWAGGTVLLNVLSAALLTFRAANRSTLPRLVWMLLWLNCLGWIVLLPAIPALNVYLSDSLAAFAIIGSIACVVLGFFSVTEDLELSPRQARSLGGSRARRLAMLVLGPGSARGRLAFVFLSLLTVLVVGCGLLYDNSPSRDARTVSTGGLAGLAYGTILLLLADWCARVPLRRFCESPLVRRMVALMTVAIACTVPPLIEVLVSMLGGRTFDDRSVVLMFCPGFGIHAVTEPDATQGVRLIALLLAGTAALAILGVQGFRLRVVTRQVVATAVDRDPRAT